MELLLDPAVWMAFLTLTALEIILGIDNIIFIAILVNRLPEHLRAKARYFGLSLAMITRILLLLSLTWIMRLTEPFFTVFKQEISGRDLILIGGGLFLLWKSVMEIHASLEGDDGKELVVRGAPTFFATLIQIALIDIVFSFDSVITAVGLVDHIPVMVAAIVVAVVVMMFAAGPISDFVDRHPSIKMLALSFLVVIGVVLIAEGFDVHVPKGYIYFAMAFSVVVEMLNIRMHRNMRKKEPVKLHKKLDEEAEAERS
ncbi:MAG: TerC family protein [Halothiobacillaceae bacterium]